MPATSNDHLQVTRALPEIPSAPSQLLASTTTGNSRSFPAPTSSTSALPPTAPAHLPPGWLDRPALLQIQLSLRKQPAKALVDHSLLADHVVDQAHALYRAELASAQARIAQLECSLSVYPPGSRRPSSAVLGFASMPFSERDAADAEISDLRKQAVTLARLLAEARIAVREERLWRDQSKPVIPAAKYEQPELAEAMQGAGDPVGRKGEPIERERRKEGWAPIQGDLVLQLLNENDGLKGQIEALKAQLAAQASSEVRHSATRLLAGSHDSSSAARCRLSLPSPPSSSEGDVDLAKVGGFAYEGSLLPSQDAVAPHLPSVATRNLHDGNGLALSASHAESFEGLHQLAAASASSQSSQEHEDGPAAAARSPRTATCRQANAAVSAAPRSAGLTWAPAPDTLGAHGAGLDAGPSVDSGSTRASFGPDSRFEEERSDHRASKRKRSTRVAAKAAEGSESLPTPPLPPVSLTAGPLDFKPDSSSAASPSTSSRSGRPLGQRLSNFDVLIEAAANSPLATATKTTASSLSTARKRKHRQLSEEAEAEEVEVEQQGLEDDDEMDVEEGRCKRGEGERKTRMPYKKWTVEEDRHLLEAVIKCGCAWDQVARQCPTRAYHQVRQRFLRGLDHGEAIPPELSHLKEAVLVKVAEFEAKKYGFAFALRRHRN
ncbi:hypothetical protein JCM11641_006665 [Rhodosporidiobolus odoratus]